MTQNQRLPKYRLPMKIFGSVLFFAVINAPWTIVGCASEPELKLTLSFSESSYEVWQPVVATLTLTNSSDENLLIIDNWTTKANYVRFQIRDEHGKQVRYIGLRGKSDPTAFRKVLRSGETIVRNTVIYSGNVKSDSVPGPYALTRTNKYSVVAAYTIQVEVLPEVWLGYVESEPVEFLLGPREDEE